MSADPLPMDVQLGLMVADSCVLVFLFAWPCINIDLFNFVFLPQARPWRAFTAWRGKAWHRWRRWCWAWARPPSPSSYPSRGSWPRCEENPRRGERQTPTREQSGQTEPGRDFRSAFMEGDEAQVLWTFEGQIQGRTPPSVSALRIGAGRSASCQRAAPGGGSASASGPESHVSEFPELRHFFVPKAFSVKTASLGGRLTQRLSVELLREEEKKIYFLNSDL